MSAMAVRRFLFCQAPPPPTVTPLLLIEYCPVYVISTAIWYLLNFWILRNIHFNFFSRWRWKFKITKYGWKSKWAQVKWRCQGYRNRYDLIERLLSCVCHKYSDLIFVDFFNITYHLHCITQYYAHQGIF